MLNESIAGTGARGGGRTGPGAGTEQPPTRSRSGVAFVLRVPLSRLLHGVISGAKSLEWAQRLISLIAGTSPVPVACPTAGDIQVAGS